MTCCRPGSSARPMAKAARRPWQPTWLTRSQFRDADVSERAESAQAAAGWALGAAGCMQGWSQPPKGCGRVGGRPLCCPFGMARRRVSCAEAPRSRSRKQGQALAVPLNRPASMRDCRSFPSACVTLTGLRACVCACCCCCC